MTEAKLFQLSYHIQGRLILAIGKGRTNKGSSVLFINEIVIRMIFCNGAVVSILLPVHFTK